MGLDEDVVSLDQSITGRWPVHSRERGSPTVFSCQLGFSIDHGARGILKWSIYHETIGSQVMWLFR